MARRKGRRGGGEGGMDMTPMIDIVFQMIIFFVCTVQLEKDAVNEQIRLAMAPHGPAVEQKNPLTITIDVDSRGQLAIARKGMSYQTLVAVLRKTVASHGQIVPVVIRGDGKTRHADVKRAMDACVEARIWKIRFAAIKDKVN